MKFKLGQATMVALFHTSIMISYYILKIPICIVLLLSPKTIENTQYSPDKAEIWDYEKLVFSHFR